MDNKELREDHPRLPVYEPGSDTLYFRDGVITSGVVHTISEIFREHPACINLIIRNSCIENERVVDDLANLISTTSRLSGIGFDNVGLDHTSIERLFAKDIRGIRIISLLNENIGDLGAICLSNYICDSSLEFLCVCNCGIESRGVRHLIDAMPTATMKVLDLSKNDIHEDVVVHLANIIPRTRLIHLNLNSINITRRGLEAICAAPTDTLVTYEFASNRLSNDHLLPILLLIALRQVKRVVLYNNLIDDVGANKLFSAIDVNQDFECIDLRSNVRITDQSVDCIIIAVHEHYCLRRILLDGTSVSEKGMYSVSRKLRANHKSRINARRFLYKSRRLRLPNTYMFGRGFLCKRVDIYRRTNVRFVISRALYLLGDDL